jgi:hypothetical protein
MVNARSRKTLLSVTIALGVLCALGATRAWSDTGAAHPGEAVTVVSCVESLDGRFCLCGVGAAVCAGEHAVTSCSASPARAAAGVCCSSPAGFCYCSADSECTDQGDRRTDGCDVTAQQP